MRGTFMLVTAMAVLTAPGQPRAASIEVPDDFGVACVDVATGAERWHSPVTDGWPPRLRIAGGDLWEGKRDESAWRRRDLDTGAVLATDAPPAAVDTTDPTAAAFWTTTDAILHERDGEARTVIATGAFIDDLVVAGDVLAFTLDKDDGVVHGWSLSGGRRRWMIRPRDLVSGFEVGDGSRVELVAGRLLVHAPPALIAVDPATGGVDWVAHAPALEGRWGAVRAVDLGATWLVTVDGLVVALDVATGQVRWTVDAGAGGASSPAATERVACFDRRDEAVIPFARDEAEVARALEVTVAGGRITGLRWQRRADVASDARRWQLYDLPASTSADAALTLTAGDQRRALDPARLRDLEGTVVLEVAGAWEDAHLILGDDDLLATE